MTTEDAMTINERRKSLTKMQTRYRAANRQLRGQLLTEMKAITGMHRKILTRLLAPPGRLPMGHASLATSMPSRAIPRRSRDEERSTLARRYALQ